MRLILLLTMLNFLCISCNQVEKSRNKDQSVLNAGDTSKHETEIQVNETIKGEEKNNDLPNLFKFENDDIIQIIELNKLSRDSMEFKITTKNLISNNSSDINGIAVKKEGAEFDEDDNGVGYLSTEYIYDSNCWLAIRIDSENYDKLKVKEYECENLRFFDCPFKSLGVMKPDK